MDIDWTLIEQDWRAGVLPQSAICSKYNISLGKLKSTAEKYGWERVPLDPLALQVAHGAAALPRFSMDSHLNEQDVRQTAILTAASIIDVHRKDVRTLRETAAKVSTCIIDFVEAVSGDEIDEQRANKALRVMGKDTPADMLVKLSNVMTKLVSIERQSYGLDALPVNPNEDNSGMVIQSEMNKLWEKVQEAQKNKTLLN